MRFTISLIMLCFTATVFAQTTTTIDAGRGDITVNVPIGYSADSPAPLIVLLHGYGSDAKRQGDYMKFDALADRYGFLLATPDGTEESGGDHNRFWNSSKACCNFFTAELDDSAYILDIINKMKGRYSIDAQRVYLIGHSNGGFMAHLAAHDHSDVIAAIASLAGAEATDPLPAPAHPVNVLQIHGTADGTIAYAGDNIRGNIFPGAVETIERWAAYNGCATTGQVVGMLDLDVNLEGIDSTITRYSEGCRIGGSAELWTIADGSHIPALSASFSEDIVQWLFAHPKVEGAVH